MVVACMRTRTSLSLGAGFSTSLIWTRPPLHTAAFMWGRTILVRWPASPWRHIRDKAAEVPLFSVERNVRPMAEALKQNLQGKLNLAGRRSGRRDLAERRVGSAAPVCGLHEH